MFEATAEKYIYIYLFLGIVVVKFEICVIYTKCIDILFMMVDISLRVPVQRRYKEPVYRAHLLEYY